MTAPESCPTPEVLRALALGRLPAGAVQQVEYHLDKCERCTALALTPDEDDALVKALRQSPSPLLPLTEDGRQVEGLIRRLEELPRYKFLAPPQEPGELGRLGTYRVLSRVGVGGMGMVFRAEGADGRAVALKVMRPELAAAPAARERFRREAESLARVEHEHVVAVLDVGDEQGVPYLAMPLLEGEPLSERLAREGRLPGGEVLRIGREIAEALGAAHQRGLIHRDVAPANVWLEVPNGRVKVLDFGLARPVAGAPPVTQIGAVLGRPLYMSPEQARGEKVDQRTDLFGLGCILYQMATGRPPWDEPQTTAALLAVQMKVPPDPRHLSPEVPAGLSRLVMRLLAKNPEDRPPDAAAVVRELAALERGPSVPPPRAGCAAGIFLLGMLAGLAASAVLVFFWPGLVAGPRDGPDPARDGATPRAEQEAEERAAVGGATAPETAEPLRSFAGHSGRVRAVALALDGRRMLSGGYDKTARLWDVADGRELFSWKARDRVQCTAFAPDGRRAAFGGWAALDLVDVEGSHAARRVPTEMSIVRAAGFSPDGKRLLAVGDYELNGWDVQTLRPTDDRHWRNRELIYVAFSPDGRLLHGSGGPEAYLWERGREAPLQVLKGHAGIVRCVALAPDGASALTGGDDGTVRLWDLRNGRERKRFPGHAGVVRCVTFSPDGARALSGGDDKVLRLWDLEGGRELRRFTGHKHAVWCAAFAPDGAQAASGGDGGALLLWRLAE